MGLFDQFPYTNFHELNLDWILNALRELEHTIDQFVSINALKYADPIQWNIVKQYEKNTIVIDPLTGTAYISVQPVPSGVSLTNSDYWTVVFDLGAFVTRAAKNFTANYEEDTTLTATMPLNAGDWVVWGDTLYKALVNITAGDTYVIDSNIEHFTIEQLYNEYLTTVADILNKVGELVDLDTSDKTSIVNAINEVVSNVTQETEDRKNKPPINVKDFGAVGDGVTNDTAAILAASTAVPGKPLLYFPNGTYLVDTTLSLENPILLSSNTNIIDSNGISMIIRPTTNDYNVAISNIEKIGAERDCPQGAAIVSNVLEMIDDDGRASFNINGDIDANINKINVTDTSGIKLGDGIISTVSSDFTNASPRSCMRVIEIGPTYIKFAPDRGDGSGYGLGGYSYTGGALSGTFTIRPRYWSCGDYNGVSTGSENNLDKQHWAGNDVVWTKGQRAIGREIDVIVKDTVPTAAECDGLLVTGQKWYPSNVIGVNVQMGGSYNGNIGSAVRNYDIGYFSNSWTAFLFDPTFNDNTQGGNSIPIAGGIVQTDFGAYNTLHPSIAVRQVINGAICLAIKRNDDVSPTGLLIRATSNDGLTQLFSVDALGNCAVYKNLTAGPITAYGDLHTTTDLQVDGDAAVTGNLHVDGNTIVDGNTTVIGNITCAGLGAASAAFDNLRVAQAVTMTPPTPNGYITLFDIDNNPVQVPVYKP